jgi:hypothetical protein
MASPSSLLAFVDAMSFRVAAGSYFVIPVASDPTMESARAGALESDGRR